MPDILILTADQAKVFQLEELAIDEGFRIKTALDVKSAKEWLSLKEFDVLLADKELPSEEQQRLADLLWQKNPLAHFVSFKIDGRDRDGSAEIKLFGAEVVSGPRAFEDLRKILQTIKPRGEIKAENFPILVVEDLDSPRDIICAYIESFGFPLITGVSSAKEALELMREKKFSCIITDVRMPEVSGSQLIEMIRKDPDFRSIPVIVLTAYGTTDCLVDCLEAGATGFLVKPPKRQDLLRELSRALRVVAEAKNPRLIKADEVENIRDILINKGM